ncbi:MAG: hypothetical protein ACJA2W_003861 [Planctomycetota bacterium]|jgi:uncharacterized protein (DUF1330 family)
MSMSLSNTTRHEILVGLHVTDNESYSNYRAVMTPLLNAVHGSFRYDFTIAEALVDDSSPAINRLFVISFPDQAAKEALFADPTYLAAKAKHFDSAVDMVNIMATYEHAG